MLAHLHECLWSFSQSSLKTSSLTCPTPCSPDLFLQKSVTRIVEEESTSAPSHTIRAASVISLRPPVASFCRPGPVPVISRKGSVSWSPSPVRVRVSPVPVRVTPPPPPCLTVPSRQGLRRHTHKPPAWFSPLSFPNSMNPIRAGAKPAPSQADMMLSRPRWFPPKLPSWNEPQPQQPKSHRPRSCQKRTNGSWCRSSVDECCRW